jgi:hypothetical protein
MRDRRVAPRFTVLAVLTLFSLSAPLFAAPVVFGPKSYAVTAHQEKNFGETIAFNGPCDTAKAVYTLVVTNGAANGTGKVKGGKITLNDEDVIDDLSKVTGTVETVIVVTSSNHLDINLKAQNNSDGSITVSIRRHIDLTANVFGDKSYTLTSNKSGNFDDSFSLTDISGPFTFILQNGNGSILPVDDARVTVNGVEIISKNDIDSRGNQNGDPNNPQIIARDVTLKAQNALHFELKTNKTPAGIVVRVVRHLSDTQGPTITLNNLHDGQVVSASPLNVTGTVTDDSGVSAFTLNGTAVTLGGGGAFQKSVSLVAGPNTLTFAATDCEGNSRQLQITVFLGGTPPQVVVLSPVEGAFSKTATVVVSGTASGSSAIASVVVNGVAATLSGNNWTASLTFPPVGGTVDGSKTITAVATDAAGSQASAQVHIVVDTTNPTISAAVQPAPNAAGWNRVTVTVSFTCADSGSGVVACPAPVTVSTDTAGQPVTGSVSDRAGNSATASVTIKRDTAAPSLTVAIPQDPASRYYAKAGGGTGTTIAGDVADTLSGIDSVTCGGAPATLTGPTYQCSITLAPGSNTVAVTATDRAGNSSTVNRQFTLIIDDTPPTIAVAPLPAPSAAGWYRGPLTVDFTCSDNQNVAVCNGRRYLNDGANQLVDGLAVDAVGNEATTSVTLNVDGTPPLLNVSSSHDVLTNQAALHVTGTSSDALSGLAGVKCNGIAAAITAGSFDCTVTLSAGFQTVVVTATDRADNQSSEQVSAKLDQTPPEVTLIDPTASVTTNSPSLVINGTATDDDQVKTLTVAGNTVSLAGDTFSATVSLSEGINHIEVRAEDRAGNATVTSIDARYVPHGAVAIASPADLAVLHGNTVSVSGTVSGPIASVQVNGIPASLSGTAFTASGVPLLQGRTVITATATTTGGEISTASVNVYRDSIPPRLTVYSPPANSDVDTPSAIVSGMVDDIVVGTINAGQVHVTVNGLPAEVVNRTFKASNVTITPGTNTIIVTATDQGGNTITVSHTVHGVAPTGARLAIQSGNDQSGTIGTALAAPLRVRALDDAGNPVAGKPLTFNVAVNNGSLAAGALSGRQITVTTDAQGDATATWTLGTRAGVANQRVDVTAAGYRGAQFFASAATGSPASIVVDMGNNQFGVTNERLPRPLVVAVVDAGGNRLNDVPVTFSVIEGGGTFGGQPNLVVHTDSDGRAWTAPTLGASGGVDNNIFWAFAPGVLSPAVFNASSAPAGPAAETKVSGVVLDNTSTPVPGVTLRIEGTSLVTQADAQGQFVFQPAPVGYVRLIADGSTAQRPGTWPSLEFAMYTNSGQNNTVGMPIFLLPIDTTRGVQVDEQHGGTITFPELPGFSLTIAPGSTTFPGGLRTGTVSATLVHNDKMPMVPGFGQQPRFLVTIQPPGALFDPPAALSIPNVDGFGPGQITELYSFDHDLGQFVAIGTGSVSADGTTISSDPGVGIIKAGWHCGGDPAGTGTTGCIQVDLDVEDDPGTSGAAVPTSRRPRLLATAARTVSGRATPLTGPKTALINTCMKLIAKGKPGGGSPPVGDATYSWTIVSGNATFISQPPCKNEVTCEASIKATDPGDVVVTVTYTTSQAADTSKPVTIKFIKLIMAASELSYLNDIDIVKDAAGSVTPVSDPVWKKGNAQNDRVVYVGNNDGGSRKIKVKAVFEITPPVPDDLKNLDLVGEVAADPGGFAGGKLTKKNVTIKKNEQKLTVDDFEVDFKLPASTYYFNPMSITWTLKPNNACADDLSKVDLGKTEVVVYVTLTTPVTAPVYLSLVHIATAGPPASSKQAVIDATWAKFGTGSGPGDVKGWDDRPFTYYKTGNDFNHVEGSIFEDFLKDTRGGGGRCGMMATLMDRTLHINGILSRVVTINPKTMTPDTSHPTNFWARGFIVKVWTYTEPGRFSAPLPAGTPPTPLTAFKYFWKTPDMSSSNEIQPEPADEKYGDLTNGVGAAGQNSLNPSEKAWPDHAIIEIPASTGVTHRWLDSSYGKEYANEADFEAKSLIGYWVNVSFAGAAASPDASNHAARKPEPPDTGVIFH